MRASKILKDKVQGTLRLFPALGLIWQSGPGWTMARVILLIIQSILPLLSLYLIKLVVDTIAASLTTADKGTAFYHVAFLIVLAGVVTLVTTLCNSLAELINTAQSQRVTDYMQDTLHAKSIEVDLECYENAQYYDTLRRAQQEAPFRPTQILNHLAQVGQQGVSLLAMTGLLLSFHWGVAGILFVAAIPSVLVQVKYVDVLYSWQRKRTPMIRQAEYLSWLLSLDIFAKEIRLFNLGTLFRQRYRCLRQQIYEERLAVATRRFVAHSGAYAFAGMLIFAAYVYIVHQTIQGNLRLGDLVLYHQALQYGQNALRGLLAGLSGLYEDNQFLHNLYEFLALKPTVIAPQYPQPVPRSLKAGIVFDHVSFQYATTTRQALTDISFTIHPGETVALVGENGSGKTTLIKLLCRLYDPTAGRITIDGIDLRHFDTLPLRRQISVIFQDYAKYHLSAQENIWLGNIDLPPVQEHITRAAYQSGADKVITRLPQGYETLLGKLFAQGEELSIGEWQKVALARAFLREAQILVLDEPTSALDAEAEYEVFKKFRQLTAGRTAILISHRLSTVRLTDRIYVLEDGSLSESGTHDELMCRGGTYARLFATQAQYYG
jgi:ATP-binding cassette subfamily B protein